MYIYVHVEGNCSVGPLETHHILYWFLQVCTPDVTYTEREIHSRYEYPCTIVQGNKISLKKETMSFRTSRIVPKTGVLLVGWGGNNGSTLTAGILANKMNISWNTKEGECKPNYFGSMTQSSTVKIGLDDAGRDVYTPLNNLLPMVNPNDLVIGGWDISSLNLAESMHRAQVLDYDLQRKLDPIMAEMRPLPSIYYPDFIAGNQKDRADNVLSGSKQDNLLEIRRNIRDFKASNGLDKVMSYLK